MPLAEAIVFLLATSDRGMPTDMIAREINLRGLHHRKDGKPVTSEQVYAVCMACRGTFIKEGGTDTALDVRESRRGGTIICNP